jgi:hypothetical protein
MTRAQKSHGYRASCKYMRLPYSSEDRVSKSQFGNLPLLTVVSLERVTRFAAN